MKIWTAQEKKSSSKQSTQLIGTLPVAFSMQGKKRAKKFSTTFTPKVLRKIQFFKWLETELRNNIDLSEQRAEIV